MSTSKAKTIERLLGLLVVVVGFTLVTMLIIELVGGTERLRTVVESAGPWAPAVYLVLKASTYIFAPLSGTSIQLASGALFGAGLGIVLSLVGSTLGAIANYWIARTLGRAGISKFAGKRGLTDVDHATRHVANWRILLAARLFLSALYDFISYAAGLSRIAFMPFVLVTFFGGIPATIILPLIGDASTSGGGPGSSVLMIVFGVLFVVILSTFVYVKLQNNRTEKLHPKNDEPS